RYETATSFARDVQRYLNDEPVQACPPSVAYRLRKLARRHSGALAAATVLGMVLLLAVSAVGWAVRDRSARLEATRHEQEARQGRISERIRLNLSESSRLASERKWSESLGAAQRAQDLLAPEDVESGLAEQVRQAVRDLEQVRELERIRAAR